MNVSFKKISMFVVIVFGMDKMFIYPIAVSAHVASTRSVWRITGSAR